MKCVRRKEFVFRRVGRSKNDDVQMGAWKRVFMEANITGEVRGKGTTVRVQLLEYNS